MLVSNLVINFSLSLSILRLVFHSHSHYIYHVLLPVQLRETENKVDKIPLVDFYYQ